MFFDKRNLLPQDQIRKDIGCSNSEWNNRDLADQYKRVIEFHGVNKKHFNSLVDRTEDLQLKNIRKLKKQTVAGYNELSKIRNYPSFDYVSDENFKMHFGQQQPEQLKSALKKDANFMQRKLDLLIFKKKLLIEKFKNLLVLRQQLTTLKKIRIPTETREKCLALEVYNEITKKSAALTLNDMYRNMKNCLKRDEAYHERLLKSLQYNCYAQRRLLLDMMGMTHLSNYYITDLVESYTKAKNEVSVQLYQRKQSTLIVSAQITHINHTYMTIAQKVQANEIIAFAEYIESYTDSVHDPIQEKLTATQKIEAKLVSGLQTKSLDNVAEKILLNNIKTIILLNEYGQLIQKKEDRERSNIGLYKKNHIACSEKYRYEEQVRTKKMEYMNKLLLDEYKIQEQLIKKIKKRDRVYNLYKKTFLVTSNTLKIIKDMVDEEPALGISFESFLRKIEILRSVLHTEGNTLRESEVNSRNEIHKKLRKKQEQEYATLILSQASVENDFYNYLHLTEVV